MFCDILVQYGQLTNENQELARYFRYLNIINSGKELNEEEQTDFLFIHKTNKRVQYLELLRNAAARGKVNHIEYEKEINNNRMLIAQGLYAAFERQLFSPTLTEQPEAQMKP